MDEYREKEIAEEMELRYRIHIVRNIFNKSIDRLSQKVEEIRECTYFRYVVSDRARIFLQNIYIIPINGEKIVKICRETRKHGFQIGDKRELLFFMITDQAKRLIPRDDLESLERAYKIYQLLIQLLDDVYNERE